jgi:hypothetical protein
MPETVPHDWRFLIMWNAAFVDTPALMLDH